MNRVSAAPGPSRQSRYGKCRGDGEDLPPVPVGPGLDVQTPSQAPEHLQADGVRRGQIDLRRRPHGNLHRDGHGPAGLLRLPAVQRRKPRRLHGCPRDDAGVGTGPHGADRHGSGRLRDGGGTGNDAGHRTDRRPLRHGGESRQVPDRPPGDRRRPDAAPSHDGIRFCRHRGRLFRRCPHPRHQLRESLSRTSLRLWSWATSTTDSSRPPASA